jgi:peptidoglycan/LPS O-acetylase OafA/YrhL
MPALTGRQAQRAADPPSPHRVASAVRVDIQGMRALAVASVVLFHFWPHRMPGGYVGVDVFFVISGFLITAHLLHRPPIRSADFAAFWARRIRRLLPASLLVLASTVALTRIFAPSLLWDATAREVIAAALYVENWSLAAQSLDYLAADAVATPVQHFWSLSVEEQFYLAWPLLLAGGLALGWRLRLSP